MVASWISSQRPSLASRNDHHTDKSSAYAQSVWTLLDAPLRRTKRSRRNRWTSRRKRPSSLKRSGIPAGALTPRNRVSGSSPEPASSDALSVFGTVHPQVVIARTLLNNDGHHLVRLYAVRLAFL